MECVMCNYGYSMNELTCDEIELIIKINSIKGSNINITIINAWFEVIE